VLAGVFDAGLDNGVVGSGTRGCGVDVYCRGGGAGLDGRSEDGGGEAEAQGERGEDSEPHFRYW